MVATSVWAPISAPHECPELFALTVAAAGDQFLAHDGAERGPAVVRNPIASPVHNSGSTGESEDEDVVPLPADHSPTCRSTRSLAREALKGHEIQRTKSPCTRYHHARARQEAAEQGRRTARRNLHKAPRATRCRPSRAAREGAPGPRHRRLRALHNGTGRQSRNVVRATIKGGGRRLIQAYHQRHRDCGRSDLDSRLSASSPPAASGTLLRALGVRSPLIGEVARRARRVMGTTLPAAHDPIRPLRGHLSWQRRRKAS